MPSAPVVSVIMPFLNAERFMEEAIQSVFEQTYADWELLLIDDGSTDESTSLARGYAARFPDRVKYLEHGGHENKGASASRNLGIRHARGRYIALLDADDVYLPEKLERQVPELEARPDVGALYGTTEYWYSWADKQEEQDRDYFIRPGLATEHVYAPPGLIDLIYLKKSAAVPCTCSMLVRSDILESTGEFESTFRNLYDDQVFYTKIFAATPVYVMSDCLDRYRQHRDSSCYVAKRTGGRRRLELAFLSWQADYLSRHESVPRAYHRAVRKSMLQMRYPIISKLLRASRRAVDRLLKREEK